MTGSESEKVQAGGSDNTTGARSSSDAEKKQWAFLSAARVYITPACIDRGWHAVVRAQRFISSELHGIQLEYKHEQVGQAAAAE